MKSRLQALRKNKWYRRVSTAFEFGVPIWLVIWECHLGNFDAVSVSVLLLLYVVLAHATEIARAGWEDAAGSWRLAANLWKSDYNHLVEQVKQIPGVTVIQEKRILQ